MKINYSISCLAILIVFSSCTRTRNQETKTESFELPSSYFGDKVDSTKATTINWKEFFGDTTLVSLIEEGLKSNLDLLSSYQKIEALRANVRYSKGLLFPTIDAAGSLGKRRYGEYTIDGVGIYDTRLSQNISKDQMIPQQIPDYFGGLQSSWEIDIRGKLRNQKKSAQARYLASVEGNNWLKTNLVAEIATAYYQLLALDFELEIVKETSILQNEALEVVLLQKEAGKANELAVQQFQAQYLFSKGLEIELQQKLIENENVINFLLGRFSQKVPRNSKAFNVEIPSQLLIGIPSDLLANRPDVRQSEHELLASKADVKAAKAAFYPSLTITSSLGNQAFNPRLFTSPESFMYTILSGLTMPLLNRSAIQAEFKSANAVQVQAMYNYQKNILNAYIEVYNQLAKLQNYDAFHKLKEEEVKVLTTSVETSSELFATGRASYYEIIFSQKNALNSNIQLMEVKKNQFYSMINLYKSLGGGWN